MEVYVYNTANEELIRRLDKEFKVVTVIQGKEDGHSGGYVLAIFDPREENEIHNKVKELYKEVDQKVTK